MAVTATVLVMAVYAVVKAVVVCVCRNTGHYSTTGCTSCHCHNNSTLPHRSWLVTFFVLVSETAVVVFDLWQLLIVAITVIIVRNYIIVVPSSGNSDYIFDGLSS